MPREGKLLARLEHWLAARAAPPTLFDVIETGDRELLAAFILKGFRATARQAVVERLDREGVSTFASELSNATATVLRVFDGIAGAWSLDNGEKLALLGLTTAAELQVLRAAPLDEVPTEIIERVAIVVDIFKATVQSRMKNQPTTFDEDLKFTATLSGSAYFADVALAAA